MSSGGDVVLSRPWSSGVGYKSKHTRGSRSLLLLVHVVSLVSQDVDSREEVASRVPSAGLGLWVAADEGAARKENSAPVGG